MDSAKLAELFFDNNYTLRNLLIEAKENKLNLSELRDSLIQYQQDLNQNLLELFNNNHDQFYKLSYIITCLNEPIQQIYEPLETFKNQLTVLCQKHDCYIEEINNKLLCIEETCKNKELATRFIKLIKIRDRLNKQIKHVDWSVGPRKQINYSDNNNQSLLLLDDQDIEHKIKCDLIERLNIELFLLNCQVIAIKPTNDELISIKKSLQTSIHGLQGQFDSWFERCFLQAIEAQDKRLINFVLLTYKQTKSIRKIDLIWTNKVLRPYLNITLTEAQLLMNDSQLKQTLRLLHEFIERHLELIEDEFVVRSFWGEIVRTLDGLERIYLLNDTEAFKRYLEIRAFLNKQDQYIKSEPNQFGLKQEEVSENSHRILEKFNLQTYFNHRASQLTLNLETSLSQQPLSEISPANIIPNATNPENNSVLRQFKLNICMHVYSLITTCWNPDLYIEALEANSLELACKIINRFADWLSKLRLSDFRITGSAAPENNRQTNFLAKQDAIMRLLLEDCDRLIALLKAFLLNPEDVEKVKARTLLLSESFAALNTGLSNVRSLQKLIER